MRLMKKNIEFLNMNIIKIMTGSCHFLIESFDFWAILIILKYKEIFIMLDELECPKFETILITAGAEGEKIAELVYNVIPENKGIKIANIVNFK